MTRRFKYISIVMLLAAVLWVANDWLNLSDQPVQPGETVRVGDEESDDQDREIPDTQEYKIETVAENLVIPWDMVFTSDDRILVTERPGTVRLIENGQVSAQPFHRFTEVSSDGEEGLMSMELDPDYESNKYIYFSLAYEDSTGEYVKVVRFTDRGGSLTDQFIVIDKIPAARFHAGSRLAFGPDNKLYITTGDATDKNLAQNLNSLAGKILRLNRDGSIPEDNPFENSPIWSYGHRNPQGIDWHPETGELYSTEHGPSGFDGPGGGDEINRIVKGENYGWPLVSHQQSTPEAKDPLITFTPAEAPGSAMFYSGDELPAWQGQMFFGALRGEGIFRVVISESDPDKVVEYEKLAKVNFGRIRTVLQGPDGYIYFMTSNRDGRGDPAETDDRVFRIIPVIK